MTNTDHRSQAAVAVRSDRAILYASLELGRASWLVTTLPPGSEKMSRRVAGGGNARAPAELLDRFRAKAEEGAGTPVRVVVIQEVGDGASRSLGAGRGRLTP